MRPFVQAVFWFTLVGVCQADSPPTMTVPVSDPNWFFSPYNWYVKGDTFAETQNTGAYFKIGFTGTQVALAVDVSMLGDVPASRWPLIRSQIDDGPTQDYRLKQADVLIPLNAKALEPGTHTLTVWFVACDFHIDRWITPVATVRVTGLVIDGNASTLPPALHAKRMVFFGDSFTEGVATVSQSWNRLNSDDATLSYAYACAARFDVEFGVVGFAGWGWTVSVASGANVPPFIDAWADQFDGQPRSLDPQPDYVVVMLGGNDYLSGLTQPGEVKDAVAAWLPNARIAFATSKIFSVVQFDGFDRGEVTDGFYAYQLAAGFDPDTYLIDLGQAAQYGIDGGFVSGTTPTSYDGLHPDAAQSAILGGWLADAIQAALGD